MNVWRVVNRVGLIFFLAVAILLFSLGILFGLWNLVVLGLVVGGLALWGLLI